MQLQPIHIIIPGAMSSSLSCCRGGSHSLIGSCSGSCSWKIQSYGNLAFFSATVDPALLASPKNTFPNADLRARPSHHEFVVDSVAAAAVDAAAASAAVGGRSVHSLTSLSCMVARWQNLIPSFLWIDPGWRAWRRNPRKGRDQILQRSGAIVQKPQGPITYDLKIRL